MLREIPGFVNPVSELSMVDQQQQQQQPTETTTSELQDDIFGSAPGSPTLAPQTANQTEVPQLPTNSERSDVPRLRSLHVTNGYRDGIANSKAQYVQAGFDEGFSLGAVLGLKAGFLLGVLEGVVRAVNSTKAVSAGAVDAQTREKTTAMYVAAREELGLRSLFAREYFGEDGIWVYDVLGADDEVTFRDIADAHPLMRKWKAEVEGLAQSLGIDLTPRARPEEIEEEKSS